MEESIYAQMSEDKKSRLRRKLRLTIIVDKSFEELFSIKFNLVRLFFCHWRFFDNADSWCDSSDCVYGA